MINNAMAVGAAHKLRFAQDLILYNLTLTDEVEGFKGSLHRETWQKDPVWQPTREFVANGGYVLGSCNGFQILCEAGLLPGVLMRNECLQYRCQSTNLLVENVETPFTRGLRAGQVLTMPISHGEGKYYADPPTLAALKARHGIVFRYATADGQVVKAANPNGSVENIAGVVNETGTVLGLMPHPERAAETAMGGTDGLLLLQSLLGTLVEDGTFLKR